MDVIVFTTLIYSYFNNNGYLLCLPTFIWRTFLALGCLPSFNWGAAIIVTATVIVMTAPLLARFRGGWRNLNEKSPVWSLEEVQNVQYFLNNKSITNMYIYIYTCLLLVLQYIIYIIYYLYIIIYNKYIYIYIILGNLRNVQFWATPIRVFPPCHGLTPCLNILECSNPKATQST